jgi:hypothetical protein
MVEATDLFTQEQPEGQMNGTRMTEDALASNLTLVMPPRIEVDFMEVEEGVDASGEPTLTQHLRRASISTYVPMTIFHEMLAGRQQVLKLKAGDATNPEHTAEMMEWMVGMTLAVWKRSEPKMTRERFGNGLQMDQILELFQRFFGGLMGRMGERGRLMQTLQTT